MKKFLASLLAVFCVSGMFQGCVTLSMRDSDKEIQEKWNRFRSVRPYPYIPVGLVTLDISNKAICDLSEQICHEVIVPYVELDKEGLISVYAQFVEDVESAMHENSGLTREGAAHYVLALWTEKYRSANVDRLRRAIPFIRNMQAGNQFTRATVRLLPKAAALLLTLNRGVMQLKHESKDDLGIIKISLAAVQLAARIEKLCWALHFLDVLKEDQAVETRAIAEYLDSFKTKEI